MKHCRIRAALALPLVLLAGCGGKGEADNRTASGQVFEASLSDAMIPLDRVTSQPPLMRDRGVEGEQAAPAGAETATSDEGPGENPFHAESPAG